MSKFDRRLIGNWENIETKQIFSFLNPSTSSSPDAAFTIVSSQIENNYIGNGTWYTHEDRKISLIHNYGNCQIEWRDYTIDQELRKLYYMANGIIEFEFTKLD